jgi:choline dehydrogenase-like flavoprotein
MKYYICSILLLAFSAATNAADEKKTEHFDVVVYGGTSSGAAVQAARMGKSVVLIEPGRHLGGLTSGGLGMTDSGDTSAIGGLSREFYQRVEKHYADPGAWKFESREQDPHFREKADARFRFEPHVAEAVFGDMLRETSMKHYHNLSFV